MAARTLMRKCLHSGTAHRIRISAGWSGTCRGAKAFSPAEKCRSQMLWDRWLRGRYHSQSFREFSTSKDDEYDDYDVDEQEEGRPDVWEDVPDAKDEDVDPTYRPYKDTGEPKLIGFPGEQIEYSDEEWVNEDEYKDPAGEPMSMEEYLGDSYDNAPFAEAGITYEKWVELKKQLNSVPNKDIEGMDKGSEGPKYHGAYPRHNNPNEHKRYKSRPKSPEQEARMRKFKEEWLKCSRMSNKMDYQPRVFSEDPHIARMNAKLSQLKPDANGFYKDFLHYISDIDVLLYAYRVLKARKLGPGTDCTLIPIDNIKMDWFYKTQKALRDKTFQFSDPKIIYVRKKDFKK